MAEKMLTAEEAAAILDVHPVTVRKLLREGRLPGVKVGTQQWRIPPAQLEAFMRGELQPTPKPAAKKAPAKRPAK